MAWLIKLFYMQNSHHNNSRALISSAHIMEQTFKRTNSKHYYTNYFHAFFSFQKPFWTEKILIAENEESLNALFTWYDYCTIVLLHQMCTYNVFNSNKFKQYETETIHRSLDYKPFIHFKYLPKYTNHLRR